MILLMLMLVFLLQSGGIRGGISYCDLYQRPGDDVLLPCLQVSLTETRCSDIHWFYNKDSGRTFLDVDDGEVEKSSPRAARLSLHTNCSLIINNITAEDAGQYTCRYLKDSTWDTQVFLNILTISPSSTDTDPNRDGDVTLSCSLFKFGGRCEPRSVRWVDEMGAELVGEGDGFRYGGQTNCVSYLTVKNQAEHSRRYTCQYVDETGVKIQALYSAASSVRDEPFIFIVGGVVGLLVLILVITVILLKCRKQVKATKDAPKLANIPEEADVTYATVNEHHTSDHKDDETEISLTYATVSLTNQKVHQKKKVKVEEKVEEVTYSAVRTR
ncbi:uncharacterized protein LOC115388769 isoform X1 [Salarias fasciatus]|uniref:uncharacterized protein LOC115388769 isoform X1 n=1 Tax=Salarias fasciatus TaxID=181472 RepID=UPI0011769710|nr:uncharacterized protein LOC115388769 isoform X1 [Salarias fasciatus]XP_029947895.1 uncharacterized protein LOC115388769 isoform X1 [Salarias fasciatus]